MAKKYQKAKRVTAEGFDLNKLAYSPQQLQDRQERPLRAVTQSNRRREADRRACRDFRFS